MIAELDTLSRTVEADCIERSAASVSDRGSLARSWCARLPERRGTRTGYQRIPALIGIVLRQRTDTSPPLGLTRGARHESTTVPPGTSPRGLDLGGPPHGGPGRPHLPFEPFECLELGRRVLESGADVHRGLSHEWKCSHSVPSQRRFGRSLSLPFVVGRSKRFEPNVSFFTERVRCYRIRGERFELWSSPKEVHRDVHRKRASLGDSLVGERHGTAVR